VSAQTRTLLCLVCLALMLSGCARTMVSPEEVARQSQPAPSYSSASHHSLVPLLYRQHDQWKGAPYRYGGTNRRGVDCSGLVYVTFRDKLNQTVPRTTAQQSKLGQAVSRSQLQAGDLVFFKTGEKLRHVGIYIEDEKFLHVSTKKGVMISRLGDYYWRDRYQYARRVR